MRHNLQGWLMAIALAGALIAGALNVPLWSYAVGLVVVLVVIGLVLNEEGKQ
jgi:fatty acid desaturase